MVKIFMSVPNAAHPIELERCRNKETALLKIRHYISQDIYETTTEGYKNARPTYFITNSKNEIL